MHLVSIGLNYRGTNVNYLNGTLNDEREIRQAFEAACNLSGKSFLGYSLVQEGGPLLPEESYRPLYAYDPVEDPSLPTKEHILNKLASLSGILKPEDLTICYYSGHGYDDGSLVVAPTNPLGSIFKEDGTVDSECLLTVNTLLSSLQTLAGAKLLILDSCYCGCFVQESETSISLIEKDEYLDDAFRKFFAPGKNPASVFVLAATTKDNTSKEPKDSMHPHGYFTEALLQGLGWNEQTGNMGDMVPPAGQKGKVSADNLYSYIHSHQQIPTKGSFHYQYQHPVLTGGSRDLVLFRY